MLAVPMLILWSMGIPLSAFLVLYRNRHHLDDLEIRQYYLMIYQGLKPNRFYWEFVNTARKIMILSINVFLSTYSLFYRVLSIILLLVIFYRIQVRQEPYKLKMNNSLERIELLAGAFTLFGGTLYIDSDTSVGLFNFIVFFMILIVNIYFITLWIYCMLDTFKQNKFIGTITSLFAMLLRIPKEKKLKAPRAAKKKLSKKSPRKIVKFIKKKHSTRYKNKTESSRKNVVSFSTKDKKDKSNSRSKYIDDSIYNEQDFVYQNPNKIGKKESTKQDINNDFHDIIDIRVEGETVKEVFEIVDRRKVNEIKLAFNRPTIDTNIMNTQKEEKKQIEPISPHKKMHFNPISEDSLDSFNNKFYEKLAQANLPKKKESSDLVHTDSLDLILEERNNSSKDFWVSNKKLLKTLTNDNKDPILAIDESDSEEAKKFIRKKTEK